MRNTLTRYISYPIQDLVNGTNILSTYKQLKKSQYLPENELKSLQFEKFLKLVHHAYKFVPYYRDVFKKHHLLPSDIKTPEDIFKIPILTKETARIENKRLVAENVNMKEVIKGVTGGTTGPPLKLLRDRSDQSYTWGAFYRWYNLIGIEPGDRITKIWGASKILDVSRADILRSNFKNFYYNRQIINSFQINDDSMPDILKRINRFKPNLIRGYLSAMIQIARYLQDKNLSFNFTPKALSSTTETLLPPFAKLIESTFGAKLYDQYGCGECNSIAFDIGDDNGMYIASEHVLLEILDEQNNPTKYNSGKFVITNLDNFAMPFIRYENGDIGAFGRKKTETPIHLPILKKIEGRQADTITLKDGSKVHGVFFTDILDELFDENPSEIHRFQVFQQVPGEIEFRIETQNKLRSEYIDSIQTVLNEYFVKVAITPMEKLPNDASGKFRYVLSNL